MVSSIHDYIERGDDSQAKHWLNNSMDTNEVDALKRTPLLVTVQTGNLSLAKLIIKKGCNINQSDATGTSPLHLALTRNNYTFIELLLNSKADPNRRSNQDEPPLCMFCSLPVEPVQAKVLDLFIKCGVKTSSTNSNGDTALHCAARHGNTELVKILIANGAVVDQPNT